MEAPTMHDHNDLLFQLFEVNGLEPLLSDRDDLDRAAIEGMLEMTTAIGADHFAPLAKRLDEMPPHYDGGAVQMPDGVAEAVAAFLETGILAGPFGEAHGGLGIPEMVQQSIAFILAAHNVSLAGYPLLTTGAARLIESFGTDAQKERFLQPMVSGRFFGTMCLSEPHAGSSLSDIKTRAVPRDDGRYDISGRKMWISAGDHELTETIVHLVLAKIPGGPPGVKGISLFIVPKHNVDENGQVGGRNDVELAGLNHKMGYRGITNCALNFGERDSCIGELVGEPHKGLTYMFQMMNEARIGVGVGATALAQAGYQASLAYARERPQGRHPDGKDPASYQVPIIEHADVRRMLLAQKAAVEASLCLALYCSRLVDRERAGDDAETCRLLLEILTPVAKSWPSEFCLEANKLAIQVLGGAGYTTDYPVERLYRDNRLNAIHEGTYGIQGLDLLGRKAVMGEGAAVRALVGAIERDLDECRDLPACAPFVAELSERLDLYKSTTIALLGRLAGEPRRTLAQATLYLDFTGHLVMGWMWLRIVRATAVAEDLSEPFMRGKEQAARYFYEAELSRMGGWAERLAGDTAAFDMQAEWF
jgi:butyryl-CoA dehydrogenase